MKQSTIILILFFSSCWTLPSWACCDANNQCDTTMHRVVCPNSKIKATILKCAGDDKSCRCEASNPC